MLQSNLGFPMLLRSTDYASLQRTSIAGNSKHMINGYMFEVPTPLGIASAVADAGALGRSQLHSQPAADEDSDDATTEGTSVPDSRTTSPVALPDGGRISSLWLSHLTAQKAAEEKARSSPCFSMPSSVAISLSGCPCCP